MDDSLVKIVAALKSKGMYSRTIMVVTTDNGGNLGGGGSNLPLRYDHEKDAPLRSIFAGLARIWKPPFLVLGRAAFGDYPLRCVC